MCAMLQFAPPDPGDVYSEDEEFLVNLADAYGNPVLVDPAVDGSAVDAKQRRCLRLGIAP